MYLAYKAIKKHRAQKAAEAAEAAEAASTPVPASSSSPLDEDTNINSESNPVSATTPKPKTPATKAQKKPCAQCVQEKSATRKYRWKLMFCLLPAFFVASLDLTIVATALPQIASHFGQYFKSI